jgi:hypothetical protein
MRPAKCERETSLFEKLTIPLLAAHSRAQGENGAVLQDLGDEQRGHAQHEPAGCVWGNSNIDNEA